MPQNIVYAKKLVLPSKEANSIQTMQMAAAFSELVAESCATGNEQKFFFYPGLRASKLKLNTVHSETAMPLPYLPQGARQILHELGIPPEFARSWQFLPAENRGAYGLRFRWNILTKLRQKPKTLFYTRDVSEAGFISRMRKAPFIDKSNSVFLFEMHEVLFKQHEAESRKDWRKTRALEHSILDAVDGLVVTNPDLARLVKELFGFNKPILVEANGYNEHLFRPLDLFSEANPWPVYSPSPAKSSQNNQEIRLVYIGSFKQGKGLPELIEALGLLPECFRLTVLGSGKPETLSMLKQLCQEKAEGNERVHFAGQVPQAEMFQACAGAHISVIPQQPQGGYFSPLKLNESLALGLPVVTTPLQVFKDSAKFIHQAADCTPPGLAAAIAELASNPELAKQLRIKGLAEAASHTWRSRATRVLQFASSLPRRCSHEIV